MYMYYIYMYIRIHVHTYLLVTYNQHLVLDTLYMTIQYNEEKPV